MTAKLTPKQEAFARAVALDDMSQADAYRSVYNADRIPDDQIYVRASEVANNSKVAVRIAELRKECITPKGMSAQKRREKLLNKMDGEHVQKITADVQTETTINIELVDDEE